MVRPHCGELWVLGRDVWAVGPLLSVFSNRHRNTPQAEALITLCASTLDVTRKIAHAHEAHDADDRPVRISIPDALQLYV